MTNATPTKLNDGSWGARVQSATVSIGDTVQIITRAGKTWTARVTEVISTRNGSSICSTQSTTARQSSATNRPNRPRRHSINTTCEQCENASSFRSDFGARLPCGGEVG